MTIPPQTQIHVQTKLETKPQKILPDSDAGNIEPRFFGDPDILIPRTMSKFKHGYTIATILNPTDVPLKVGRNHLLEGVYATENTQGAASMVSENDFDIEVESE